MEDDEYVETSEPEENETLRDYERVELQPHRRSLDDQSPRKRIKLNHTSDSCIYLSTAPVEVVTYLPSPPSASPIGVLPKHNGSQLLSPADTLRCRKAYDRDLVTPQGHTEIPPLGDMKHEQPDFTLPSQSNKSQITLHIPSLDSARNSRARSLSAPERPFIRDTIILSGLGCCLKRSKSSSSYSRSTGAVSQMHRARSLQGSHTLTSPSQAEGVTLPRGLHLDAYLASEIGGPHIQPSGYGGDQTNGLTGPAQSTRTSDNLTNAPRYSLRKRALAQIKPYTVEKLQYKHALSANPDAIVSYRELHLNDHDHADEVFEKSQALWEPDSDADQRKLDDIGIQANKKAKYCQRLNGAVGGYAGSGNGLVPYPDILQDLPLTDEEEAQDIQATSKAARRAMWELKARLVHVGNERKQRPKPFPVRKPLHSAESSAIETHTLRSPSLLSDYSQPSPWRSVEEEPGVHTPPTSSPHPLLSDELSPVDPHSDLFRDDKTTEDGPQSQDDEPGPESLSDEEAGMLQGSESELGSGDSSPLPSKRNAKEHKNFKLLNRLYPTFMVEKLLGGSSAAPRRPSKQSTSEPSSDEDDEVELLPGQTKTRWSKNTWDLPLREVKGDEDSSDDDPSTAEEVHTASRRTQTGWDVQHDYLDLTNVQEFEEDSEVEVDDRYIQEYLNNNVMIPPRIPPRGKMQPESLIDYMLNGTRRIGATLTPRRVIRSASGANRTARKPTFDITTGGARKERQTLLDVDDRQHTKKRSVTHVVRPRHNHLDIENVEPRNEWHGARHVPSLDASKKRSGKTKAQKPRRRVRGDGLYTFTSNDVHVVTGRRETGMITIDAEDHDFYQAIAPLSESWTSFSQTAKTTTGLKPQDPSNIPSQNHDRCAETRPLPTRRYQSIRDDFNIQALHSGLSFSADTYIGTGMLYQLIAVISFKTHPPVPGTCTFQDIALGPTTPIDEFSDVLRRIFDLYFEILKNPTEATEQTPNWRALHHVASQTLSWLLAAAAETGSKLLKSVVQEQTSIFMTRMRHSALETSSMNIFTLSTCWFLVELFARMGLLLPATLNSLEQPILMLVEYLLSYGLERTMAPILDGITLDGSTTAQYAAELWVSLFHLTDSLAATVESSGKQMHPFWMVVKGALEASNVKKPNLEISEGIWQSIFSLCALSQFSIHGMTTGVPRLPACWELVAYALKRIRLHADPTADRFLPHPSLIKRDQYIGFITNRCFYLWNRWHWQLTTASTLFSQLVEIFRSRKFAGLRHERSEYPSFLSENNWNALSKHEPKDTAFALFLKLLVQAATCDKTGTDNTLSPRIKKLLSMTTPVGSLPFSKTTPIVLQDLSMLYNRLSAIAIGIHLDPTLHTSRISQAQTYVNFSDADDTTRVAVMRGMLYLAVMLKNAKLPMDGIKTWVHNMASTLVQDFRRLHNTGRVSTPDAERNVLEARLACSVQALVRSVHHIFASYKDSECPDPLLLSSLLPIFNAPKALSHTPKTVDMMRKVVQAFLDARKAALPQPELPRIIRPVSRESQESQDEYGIMEMDYDDPDFLIAVGVEVEKTGIPNFTAAQEAALKTPLDDFFFWWTWRKLDDQILNSGLVNNSIHIDHWLDCWLGCVDVKVYASGKTWRPFLDFTKRWKLSDSQNRRMNLNMWMRVIVLDPMTYVNNIDESIEAFMMALVSTRSTLENKFIQLVLSIDGDGHPLLVSLPKNWVSERDSRPQDILRTILGNIAHRLRQVAMGEETLALDCEKYIGFCIKTFQIMQENYLDLEGGSEQQQNYLRWILDIFGTIGNYDELRMHPRLAHWISWGRGLS